MPRENQKEVDQRNARNVNASDFSGTVFRSDKSCFLAKPPSPALSPGTLLAPCLSLPHGHHLVLSLQSDPLGILASSLLTSKDLTSTFQLTSSQIFLWRALLIHRLLSSVMKGKEGSYVPSSDQYPWEPLWEFWLRLDEINSELEMEGWFPWAAKTPRSNPSPERDMTNMESSNNKPELLPSLCWPPLAVVANVLAHLIAKQNFTSVL